ncbi:MAG: recombinase family protein [Oligoflexales bacterium]
MQSQTIAGYIQGSIVERKKLKGELLSWLVEKDLPKVECWYEESLGSRKKFQELRKNFNQIDILIVHDLHTLVRTLAHALDVLQHLERNDIRLIIMDAHCDIQWKSAEGKSIASLCAVLNTVEDSYTSIRKKNLEKLKHHHANQRKRTCGDELYRQVLDLRQQGKSLRFIASEVGMSYGSVQSLIKSESL